MRHRLLLCIFSALWMSAQPDRVSAETAPAGSCEDVRFDVDSGGPSDKVLICAGVDKARSFFRLHGVEAGGALRIGVHAGYLETPAVHIGQFDPGSGRIALLTVEQTERMCDTEVPFGVEMNDALYVSFVVHEVAHAIVHRHLEGAGAPRLLHEYLAYVAQIATMDPALQAEVLRLNPVSPFLALDEMSFTYYLLDPNAFGVKAFRHYRSQPDRGRFIRGLLSGAAGTGSARRK